jgi:hypothetical protein
MKRVLHVITELTPGGGPPGYLHRLRAAIAAHPVDGYAVEFRCVPLAPPQPRADWRHALPTYYRLAHPDPLSDDDWDADLVVVHNSVMAAQLLARRRGRRRSP